MCLYLAQVVLVDALLVSLLVLTAPPVTTTDGENAGTTTAGARVAPMEAPEEPGGGEKASLFMKPQQDERNSFLFF